MMRFNELAWFSLNAVLMASLLSMSAALPPAPAVETSAQPASETTAASSSDTSTSVAAPAAETRSVTAPAPSIPRVQGEREYDDD